MGSSLIPKILLGLLGVFVMLVTLGQCSMRMEMIEQQQQLEQMYNGQMNDMYMQGQQMDQQTQQMQQQMQMEMQQMQQQMNQGYQGY